GLISNDSSKGLIVLSFPLYVPVVTFLPPSILSSHTNSLPTSNDSLISSLGAISYLLLSSIPTTELLSNSTRSLYCPTALISTCSPSSPLTIIVLSGSTTSYLMFSAFPSTTS